MYLTSLLCLYLQLDFFYGMDELYAYGIILSLYVGMWDDLIYIFIGHVSYY